MTSTDQHHEDRAALEAAWDEYRDRLTAAWSGQGAAFHAAWQARGAYDQEQVERLRAVAERVIALVDPDRYYHERVSHDLEQSSGECIYCDIREMVRDARAILASVPRATGESAEEMVSQSEIDRHNAEYQEELRAVRQAQIANSVDIEKW